LTHRVGGGLRRPPAREQPERATLAGVDQLGDLVELGRAEAIAAGWRQVARDVEDRLPAVVEGTADVEPAPGQYAVGALDRFLRVRGDSLRVLDDLDVLGWLEPEAGGDGVEVAPQPQRR